MKRVIIVVGLLAIALVLVVLAVTHRHREQEVHAASTSSATPARIGPAPGAQPAADTSQGFLYGRITTLEGGTYEGRLRWGTGEEAFWSDYFNGAKAENPWAAQVPPERLPKESRPVKILGFKIADREKPANTDRPFMARFGDIARIEAHGRDVRVTLKSGTSFDLDRFEASDFDDGVQVWDAKGGVVKLESEWIRGLESIELLPTPPLTGAPSRLHGTVRTRHGDFTGFLQWNREKGVGTDELHGRTIEGDLRLPFDTIRSIERRSGDKYLVSMLDGREIELSLRADRGIYVDDPRYGRVLISWDVFERVELGPTGSGPAYGAFPPGRPLSGSVTTRAGDRLTGRLVYDLDESETTETLDAPSEGVDYTIPFGMVASIETGDPRATVTLRSGEKLRLERAGDLGEKNAGLLIFVAGQDQPEYVPWADVARIAFDLPLE